MIAYDRLKSLGVTLLDAVGFYERHQHVAARSRIALGAAWPESIASKGSQGLKPRSLAALRSTIIRLIQHLGETTNADPVRPEHIEAWLIGGGVAGPDPEGLSQRCHHLLLVAQGAGLLLYQSMRRCDRAHRGRDFLPRRLADSFHSLPPVLGNILLRQRPRLGNKIPESMRGEG